MAQQRIKTRSAVRVTKGQSKPSTEKKEDNRDIRLIGVLLAFIAFDIWIAEEVGALMTASILAMQWIIILLLVRRLGLSRVVRLSDFMPSFGVKK
jgi:hypothetical protein